MRVGCSAVDSFSNPGVLAVIAKLQKAEIRPRPFSEPSNSGGTPAIYAAVIHSLLEFKENASDLKELTDLKHLPI